MEFQNIRIRTYDQKSFKFNLYHNVDAKAKLKEIKMSRYREGGPKYASKNENREIGNANWIHIPDNNKSQCEVGELSDSIRLANFVAKLQQNILKALCKGSESKFILEDDYWNSREQKHLTQHRSRNSNPPITSFMRPSAFSYKRSKSST